MEQCCSDYKILIILLRAFFINAEISINRLNSTSQKIENQPLIREDI
jgi:hypothetical protein